MCILNWWNTIIDHRVEDNNDGPVSSFNTREFPRVDMETIECAIGEMRNSDSVLLIDCQMTNSKNTATDGDSRKYKTFADNYPESLEVEGT